MFCPQQNVSGLSNTCTYTIQNWRPTVQDQLPGRGRDQRLLEGLVVELSHLRPQPVEGALLGSLGLLGLGQQRLLQLEPVQLLFLTTRCHRCASGRLEGRVILLALGLRQARSHLNLATYPWSSCFSYVLLISFYL